MGPHPFLPKEWLYTYISTADPYRGKLRAGITGLWQVSGRTELSHEELVRIDLYYFENWSLTGDMAILWRTIRIVSKPGW